MDSPPVVVPDDVLKPELETDPLALSVPEVAKDDLEILTKMGYKQDLVSTCPALYRGVPCSH